MTTRRDVLQAGAAAAAIVAAARLGGLGRALAQQKISESDLLRFTRVGNVTLLHISDLHAQLLPVHLREPSVNVGFGEARGQSPHITGKDFLKHHGIAAKSAAAYALTSEDFAALAKSYGRIGGLDRLATAVKSVRAERGQDRVLLLDSGNTFQGSFASYQTKGQDVANCMKLLRPDAMTGHWEFAYGEARLNELTASLGYPLLAFNVRDIEHGKSVLPAYKIFEKGGVRVAVLGHAYPHTAFMHPRSVLPAWNFSLREDDVRANIDKAKREGASLVVLLSQSGFDADRKLASRVPGIDVILTGQTDALPEPMLVDKTLLIASGSHGKFLSRLDLDVRAEGVRDYRYKLIPLFADAITPDPAMTAAVDQARGRFLGDLLRTVGRSDALLYRRGTFQSTFDDLIGAALLAERDAQIALSPGYRWGTTVLPGAPITVEDIHNVTSITHPEVYRTSLSGHRIKELLEDVADGLCNPDAYQRRGQDMLRCAGLRYTLDVGKPHGGRISALQLRNGKAVEAGKNYVTAGWGAVAERAEGPPVWDLVERHVARVKTVRTRPQSDVKVVGA